MNKLISFFGSTILSKIVLVPVYFAVIVLYFGLFGTFYTYAIERFQDIYSLVQQLLDYITLDSFSSNLKPLLLAMLSSIGFTTTVNGFIPLYSTTMHFWAIIFVAKFILYLYRKFLTFLLEIKKVIEWLLM